MHTPRRKFLTYANVLATLALFVALGGSAYAATLITGKQIKDGSITSADIKNGSLLALDFKAGQVPAGPAGPAGTAGAAGAAGAPGVAGTALAFAHINADGTVDAANSKGIVAANVAKPSLGTYCISGLTTFTPKNTVANVGANGAAISAVTGLGAVLTCGVGTQVAVQAFDDLGALGDNDIWLALN